MELDEFLVLPMSAVASAILDFSIPSTGSMAIGFAVGFREGGFARSDLMRRRRQ
jgi:hypothetical protein